MNKLKMTCVEISQTVVHFSVTATDDTCYAASNIGVQVLDGSIFELGADYDLNLDKISK